MITCILFYEQSDNIIRKEESKETCGMKNSGQLYRTVELRINTSGTFYAALYCNIHGLWENYKHIKIK